MTCSWSCKGAAKFYDQRLQFGLQESHHKRGSFERFKMSLKRVHTLKTIQKPTQFLRIPLIIQASKSQFQSSLQQLTDDVVKTFPSTDDYVPADAVLPLQMMHLTLRLFRLNTQSQVQHVCHGLGNLDVDGLLKKAAASAALQGKSAM